MSSHPVQLTFQHIRYAFLDRDGVINRKPPEGQYVGRWQDFHLLPGVPDAIASLNRADIRVIVVSNQRGIALGLYTSADVDSLHEQLSRHLALSNARVDAFYYCPHDKNQCACRKPRTGLFEQAFRDYPDAATTNSLVIGDSLSDIEAARNFGLPSIFIEGDPSTRKPGAEDAAALASAVAPSLSDAVARYLL